MEVARRAKSCALVVVNGVTLSTAGVWLRNWQQLPSMLIIRVQSTCMVAQHEGCMDRPPGIAHIAAGAVVQLTSSTIHNTAHFLSMLKRQLPRFLL